MILRCQVEFCLREERAGKKYNITLKKKKKKKVGVGGSLVCGGTEMKFADVSYCYFYLKADMNAAFVFKIENSQPLVFGRTSQNSFFIL